MESKLITWSRRLLAVAQTGRHFTENPYDKERYEEIEKIAAEMLVSQANVSEKEILDWSKGQLGYATPKIDVRAVVFNDNKLLMVREISDNCWTLPGGWCDVNYSPRETVEKEVFEESGYIVKATQLLAVYDKRKHDHPPSLEHAYKLYILCELKGGAAATSTETSAVEWYDQSNIPENLSTPRATRANIVNMFEWLRDPNRPVEFD